jgi:hypothetical protein
MARRVFFSFHYDLDVWRASQVRNSWVVRPDREYAGRFADAASWEQIQRRGDDAVKRWIDAQLLNTSVTVVLVGAQTASRPFVNYEIEESHKRGNGMLAVKIHSMKNQFGVTSLPGKNPLDNFTLQQRPLSMFYQTYDWVLHNGYKYLGDWVEAAAKNAGR